MPQGSSAVRPTNGLYLYLTFMVHNIHQLNQRNGFLDAKNMSDSKCRFRLMRPGRLEKRSLAQMHGRGILPEISARVPLL